MLKLRLTCLILIISNIIFNSLFFIQGCYASDKLDISSDTLVIDTNNNISIFEGKVTVAFKDIILNTNKIKVIYTPKVSEQKNSRKAEVEKIIINNHFTARKINHINKKIIEENIEADYAEYFPVERKLQIHGNVKLSKNNTTIFCDELTYFTDMVSINKTK
jgi:lipopolysaccharide transport protein LptA